MLRFLILGSAIGLFSAVVPGPFSALVAAAALREGFWGGVRIAVVPLITESVVLVATTLLVSRLPEEALRWLGLLGALFLLYLARRVWKEAREAGEQEEDEQEVPKTRSTVEAMILAVLSPAPWVFWLFVGSPLLMSAWREGWAPAVLFVASFLLWLVGVHIALAAAAAYGRRSLSHAWRKRLRLAASGGLAIAAGFLAWYTWTGDFRRMVTGSEELTEAVDSAIKRPPP